MSDDGLARDKPTAMNRAVFCGLITLLLVAGAIFIPDMALSRALDMPLRWLSLAAALIFLGLTISAVRAMHRKSELSPVGKQVGGGVTSKLPLLLLREVERRSRIQ
jgi:hypothetical protein